MSNEVPRSLLVGCGGNDTAENFSIRSDNLATIHTFDGSRTISNKHSCKITYPYITSIANQKNSDTRVLLSRHFSLTVKDSSTIPKNIECFDVNGGYIIAGTSDGNIIIWRLSDGELLAEHNLHIGGITCLEIDTSIWVLYVASNLGRVGTWCIPDLFDTCEPDATWSIHTLRIEDMVISNSGRVFTISLDKTLKCYDSICQCEILSVSFPSELTCICLSNNGSIVYVGDICGDIYQVMINDSSYIQNHFKGHEKSITDLAISHDDRALYSASLDMSIRKWDTSNGKSVNNRTNLSSIPFSLRWIPNIGDENLVESPDNKIKMKNDKKKNSFTFPRLKRTISGKDEVFVTADPLEVPIISLEEEARIAMNDLTNSKNQLEDGVFSLFADI